MSATEIIEQIKLLPAPQFEELAQWIDARREHSLDGKDVRDLRVDGSPWEDTPEAIREWVAWSHDLAPVFPGEELKEFEANLAIMRVE